MRANKLKIVKKVTAWGWQLQKSLAEARNDLFFRANDLPVTR
jgi:hypothetical protein